jgi:uroporphyrinogen-III decarboxylase
MQGPVDVAGQVWGEENLFRAMFEHPAAAHHLISLAADLLISFHKAQEAVVSEFVGLHCPGNLWLPPGFGTALSEDYAPLLSPRLYEEFSLPYVNRISDACGGVSVHCCGNFTHNFDNFLKIKNLRLLNPAPPIVDWETIVAKFGEVCTLAPGMSLGGDKLWRDAAGFQQYLDETTPKTAHLFVFG